jgi:hypothetical protein
LLAPAYVKQAVFGVTIQDVTLYAMPNTKIV